MKRSRIQHEDQIRIRQAFANIPAEQKRALAEKLGSSMNYIHQVTGGHIQVSAARAKEIARYMRKPGIAKVLRPDIFG